MTWTHEKPTTPGWYWWRSCVEDNLPVVLCVIDDGNEEGHLEADGRPVEEITAEGGHWSSEPVRQPEEG